MKERIEIDSKYKWDLSKIFASDSEWERVFSDIKTQAKSLEKFKGLLREKDNILKCLKAKSNLSQKLSNLYVYSKMRLDEDGRVDLYQNQFKRIEVFLSSFAEITAFIIPELSSLEEEFLKELSQDDNFSDFSYMLEKLVKKKQHILTKEEEVILAGVTSFANDFDNIFSMYNNIEIKFKSIKDSQNKSVKMSHGLYSIYMTDEDRDVRKAAFKSMFKPYKEMIETITAIYGGNVKVDCFFAKSRKYKSALHAALSGEDVDESIYNKLVKHIHSNLKTLHNYMELRAKILGVNKLNMYDMHVPLFTGSYKLEYQEAYDLVKAALSILGSDYQSLLVKAQDENWIDVYENKGKRSGAYSWGTYSSNPYVLLNYYPTTNNIFTIAHELGHSIHSFYSNTTQVYEKSKYEIFVAEVASTVNEILLLKYLMKNADDKELKKYLNSYYLDMFRTTVFRQTQFAEFELGAHRMYENNMPLTSQNLCKMYLSLNRKYYGKSVISNSDIQYEWARIPHFYNSFYVYKYATGFISAVNIASDIINTNGKSFDKYKNFLSAGGSASPVEILKLAGVDLTKDEPYINAMKEFEDTLESLRREV